jgi:hypothetical protein
MLGADIDMRGSDGGLAADRGVAERGIEAGIFVRHQDQPGRFRALRPGLGDRFLIETHLSSGREEKMVDPGGDHRSDDGLADVAHLDLSGGRYVF